MITNIEQLDIEQRYTYADYLTWQFNERVELLWGKIFKMSPAPSTEHQRISGNLYRDIANFVKFSKCQVFHAPFDVRLTSKDNKLESVVQPDIVVVCDESKLDDKGCIGAPDLIIEILSPSSARKDMKYKLHLYEESGVPEYWVVDPLDGLIQVFSLDNNKYQLNRPYTCEDRVSSFVINGLTINLQEIFPNLLKESEELYGENVKRIY